MNKNALYYVASALWGIPGVIISVKGVKTYMLMPAHSLWWLMLITVFVLVCFFFMFRGAVDKYSALIAAQPQKTSLWHTFPLRGWVLIILCYALASPLSSFPDCRWSSRRPSIPGLVQCFFSLPSGLCSII